MATAKLNYNQKKATDFYRHRLVCLILCRWWYVLPEWPPVDYDYSEALKRENLYLCDELNWNSSSKYDDDGRLKCYELLNYSGVFVNCDGKVNDLRPNEGKPSYNNLNNLETPELISLLHTAINNQIKELEMSPYINLESEIIEKIKIILNSILLEFHKSN